MAPKFGTSGLRGLAAELTDAVVADHVAAFLRACPTGAAVHVGRDLRASSPRIAEAVVAAARARGVDVVRHGVLPTPALALAAMGAGAAAVMVTGSHIPADRNGLKFYTPGGEIGKADEAAIVAGLGAPVAPGPEGAVHDDGGALARYRDRYVAAFGAGALAGLRVGVYEHSSAARDVLGEILRALGAETVPLGRSEAFVPVDTEAVEPDTRARLADWAAAHRLSAIVSTDGDGDRPMVAGADGALVAGDVLGPVAARLLGARRVVTPVSSNTLVEAMGAFEVVRTRIGSPYVIAGMEEGGHPAVVGYEANGGLLLGFEAQAPAGRIAPLATRDGVLPILAALAAARHAGTDLAGLVGALPRRATATDRLKDVPPERGAALVAELSGDADRRAAFFAAGAPEAAVDRTDGLRVTFGNGAIVHLRPSGNAPEFRCQAEADARDRAEALLRTHMARAARALRPDAEAGAERGAEGGAGAG